MVEACPGDLIEVSLPENPTTGYRWDLRATDPAVIGPVRSEFSSTSGAEHQAGGGGHRTFSFGTVLPGRTELEWALRRPWEPPGTPPARWNATIVVGAEQREA